MFVTLLMCLFAFTNADNITIITTWRDDKFQLLQQFWTNTGFSPLGDTHDTRNEYLLSHDEKVNLALIGSVPNHGITHVRIHWVLDLITLRDATPSFNYQNLDELIGWLHQHGLVPSVELMGNPGNHFHNFRTQADDWNLLIDEIVGRYLDLYGPIYMRKWRFELMNEPDLRMYNSYNFTLAEYIDYFVATGRALRHVIGPAGLFRDNRENHPLCWGLLEYCNANPCNLKTITFHRKGDGVGSNVVREGLDLIDFIRGSYPNLSHVSFGNDEADVMTGWHKPEEWRSDVRYASLVLQIIIGHVSEMHVKRNIPFEILSNDNAFINYHPHYFTQRTLLARFQMNNTVPHHVQFFAKPVYSVMGLLSLLGKYVIDVQYIPRDNGFSYITTAEKYRINFLGVLTNDSFGQDYHTDDYYQHITIKINVMDARDPGMYAVYVMDNMVTNPHKVWKDAGGPHFPDLLLRRRMRDCEGLKALYYGTVKTDQHKITVTLPRTYNPTIVGVNYCNANYKRPGVVENLRFIKVNDNEVLLMWDNESSGSRCLKTYVVEFKGLNEKRYKRITVKDSIFLYFHFDGYVHGTEGSVLGTYKVAAVDYFGRYGVYSKSLTISSL